MRYWLQNGDRHDRRRFLAGGYAAELIPKQSPFSEPLFGATRGQTVLLYCNGLGPVNNQPADGALARSSPLSTTTTRPAVAIGGVSSPAATLPVN